MKPKHQGTQLRSRDFQAHRTCFSALGFTGLSQLKSCFNCMAVSFLGMNHWVQRRPFWGWRDVTRPCGGQDSGWQLKAFVTSLCFPFLYHLSLALFKRRVLVEGNDLEGGGIGRDTKSKNKNILVERWGGALNEKQYIKQLLCVVPKNPFLWLFNIISPTLKQGLRQPKWSLKS